MKVFFYLAVTCLVILCATEKAVAQSTSFSVLEAKYSSPVFGRNSFLFDPSMDMKEIQSVIDTLFKRQSGRRSEFSNNRYALLFQPGVYNLDIRVDYYMHIIGLGESPDDVVIKGAVRSNTTHGNSVLTNFWRGVENLCVEPENSTMVWGVSQAAPLRRVHVKGNLQLFDKGYASGGFIADSKVDGVVSSGPQQQWLTRNSEIGSWTGKNWNMFFMGVKGAPETNFLEMAYTNIEKTPGVKEKPYLVFKKGKYFVHVPSLKRNSAGPSWTGGGKTGDEIQLKKFYIANPQKDNSATINKSLAEGKNILFSPGRYFLESPLKVNSPGTIVMGIGMATLIPLNGTSVLDIADTEGIIISGLTIDAGSKFSQSLMNIGSKVVTLSHASNPIFLFDLFFRVGGPAEGSAGACLVVNSNDVIIDHVWLWRADHGNGVGWEKNKCANGLIVNGENVTVYGLFNEHFQEYQTLWNGNGGKVYFYQSEMPYDSPSVDAWKHGDVFGYASYKVSDKVTSHEAWALGIYNVFYNAPCICDNAIECPPALESSFHHMITFWLNGNKESIVKSIINGKGAAVHVNNRKAMLK